jgi:predicted porin
VRWTPRIRIKETHIHQVAYCDAAVVVACQALLAAAQTSSDVTLYGIVDMAVSKRSKTHLEIDHTRWCSGYQDAGNKETATGVPLDTTHVF